MSEWDKKVYAPFIDASVMQEIEETKNLRQLEKDICDQLSQVIDKLDKIMDSSRFPAEYRERLYLMRVSFEAAQRLIDPLYGIELPKITKEQLVKVLDSIEDD